MSSHPLPVSTGVREQLVHECTAMARYALASGMPLPAALADTVERAASAPAGGDVAPIARAHAQLSRLVAPATPRALLLMGDEHSAGRRFPMLGPVGLVRRMMVAAVISILVFIATSLTTYVDHDTVSIHNSSGVALLVVELFWLSAAAMGASFAMLMKVSGYVVKRSYDPKYESSYWIKFFLGVMAGFILVALVPIHDANGSAIELARPTLAMLGGFSASAVYRILMRMVETVEGVFSPDRKDEIHQREQAAVARAQEETAQGKMAVAGQLVSLQQEVAAGASGDAVSARIRDIVTALVPDPDTGSPRGRVALPGVSIAPAEPAVSAVAE